MPLHLTPGELSQVRQRPHRTRIWLSVYQPGTVLAAKIVQPTIATAARQISISVLGGDVYSVTRGMTCYVGTTPGGQDMGRIRAISCTPTTLTLAENAIAWRDGWYLTVVAYYEPWAVFPRIILDNNNVPLFYKDYDISYSNQNQSPDPVAGMGPNHAGFMATGALGIYWSASGSFNVEDNSTPTGYAWNFEGGYPTASFVHTPGYIQYTGAGHFVTSLTVVGNNGKAFTGRRHVSIYTRPDEGPRPPILRYSLSSFEGSRDDGGYSIRIAVHERADFGVIVDGAMVVLFSDDWQGGVRGKKAAGAENRSSILFAGYIEDDSIRLSPADSSLEFNARSITGIAQRLATYSATLESKTNAMTWNEFANLTIDKAVIHFLRWHSTLLDIADFSPTNDTEGVQYADFGRGNLYEATNGLYQSALLGSLIADRQGKMWAEIDVSVMPTGTTRLAAVGTGTKITRQDWRSEIAFARYATDRLSYLELGGIAYSGPLSGTFGAFLAGAPGDAAGYQGSVERASGLALESQDQLNRLVGLAYARANAVFPEVDLPLAGDYRFIDIAPQSRLLLTVDVDETYRGIVWTDKPFNPTTISYEPKGEEQALLMTARLREETHGPPGVKVDFPIEPPYDQWDLPDWDIEFPPIIPFPAIIPIVIPPVGIGDYVYALVNGYYMKTSNFWSHTGSGPTWSLVNAPGSVTGSISSGNRMFILSPTDPANLVYIGTEDAGGFTGRTIAGFSGPNPSAFEWFSTADCVLHLGTNLQRRIGSVRFIPAIGNYLVGDAGRALAGEQPMWVEGIVAGAWSSYGIGEGGYPGCHDPDDHWQWLGGQNFLNLGIWTRKSTNGGRSWTAQFDIAFGRTWAQDIIPQHVYFMSNVVGSVNRFYLHPNAWIGVASSADWLNITPFIGVSPYTPSYGGSVGEGSICNAFKFFPDGSMFGLMDRVSGVGGPANVEMRRTSAFGTWQIVNTSPFTYYALDYYKPVPSRLVCYRSSTVQGIYGSQDGGNSWVDKTGNAKSVALGAWGISSCRGLKYVWTR